MENEKRKVNKITCVRAISTDELFKEALGDLFSERYLSNQSKYFDVSTFIFEVSTPLTAWRYL